VGTLGCSAVVNGAASAFLACLQDTPAGAVGREWRSMAGPALPNLLVSDRGREPLAGMLASSLDLAARVDT
jgi:hypothetical protein